MSRFTFFVLLVLLCSVHAQRNRRRRERDEEDDADADAEAVECPEDAMSSMKEGFDCVQEFPVTPDEAMNIHWRVNGTLLRMALEAESTGWLGVAFAEQAGSMVPADFIIGYVDGDSVSVMPYFATSRAINEENVSEDVELTDVGGEEEDGVTTVYFTRDTAMEGNVPIDLTAMTDINVALGPGDELAYHMNRRAAGVIQFS